MSEVSRSKSAFWGTISAQAFSIISMLVSIISTPLMVKFLSKDAYGLSIIFFQIINYLALFDFGLSAAVIRNLALHRGDDDYNRGMVNRIMSTGVLVAAGFGGFVTLLGLGLAPFLPDLYDLQPELAGPAVPILVTLSLLAGVQFVQRGLGGIFFAHHRQALISTPVFFVNLLTTGVTLLLLWRGVGLWSFAYANMFQLVSVVLVQVLLLRRYYPALEIKARHFDKQLTRSMLQYGVFLFLQGLATQVILQTDRLVIGKLLSLAAVAVFSITVRIPEVGMHLLNRITDNALPAVAEIIMHEGAERARLYLRRILSLISVLGITAAWLMVALDEWFIDLWVGPDFFAGRSILILALIIMVQQTLVQTGSFFLNMKGDTRRSSVVAMVEAALNITLSVSLGYHLGMRGILLGTIIASCCTSTWYIPYLLRNAFSVPILSTVIRPVVVPLLVTSALGLVVQQVVSWMQAVLPNTWLSFFCAAAVAGLLMGPAVWLLFLRSLLGEYVPVRWRPFLRVPILEQAATPS